MIKPEHILIKLVNSNNSRWPSFNVNKNTGTVEISFVDILVINIYTETNTLVVTKCDDDHRELNGLKDEILANEQAVIALAKAYVRGFRHGALMYC